MNKREAALTGAQLREAFCLTADLSDQALQAMMAFRKVHPALTEIRSRWPQVQDKEEVREVAIYTDGSAVTGPPWKLQSSGFGFVVLSVEQFPRLVGMGYAPVIIDPGLEGFAALPEGIWLEGSAWLVGFSALPEAVTVGRAALLIACELVGSAGGGGGGGSSGTSTMHMLCASLVLLM